MEHVLTEVNGEDAPTRNQGRKFDGETAGAAAGIENGLVAASVDALENTTAPTVLRVGESVITGGIPLADHIVH